MKGVIRIGDMRCSGDQGFIHRNRPMASLGHRRDFSCILITCLPQAGRR